MGKLRGQAGFGAVEGLIIVVVLAVIGLGGYYVWHGQKKTAAGGNNKEPAVVYTADQLTAVAKQVYYRGSGAADKTSVTACGQNYAGKGCPFTTALAAKMTQFVAQLQPGAGVPLLGGAQEVPQGSLSYTASPSPTGGTVEVVLSPDTASEDTDTIIWNLTLTGTGGRLLVSDITIAKDYLLSSHPGSRAPDCGPVEIYKTLSC